VGPFSPQQNEAIDLVIEKYAGLSVPACGGGRRLARPYPSQMQEFRHASPTEVDPRAHRARCLLPG
jgi:hypothetical protein